MTAGSATCRHCGTRRFTAYAALWRDVPGPAESGPTSAGTGTGRLRPVQLRPRRCDAR
ncbi:DUF6255 family natural product biosynthesis protein [Streptomyces thioluteus]|uniref:DUF6255 family natural product biosynthesis protein n=1 Tax=Streptomyces thioluteus TaxID=66431 RepID=UPI003CD0715E